ncbi:hypothetical protein Leryth_010018 [Lithospermum erythrorhizon]|nr:hypothetical protein Leryth_010018 [Lithospermum erythrorhizon]
MPSTNASLMEMEFEELLNTLALASIKTCTCLSSLTYNSNLSLIIQLKGCLPLSSISWLLKVPSLRREIDFRLIQYIWPFAHCSPHQCIYSKGKEIRKQHFKLWFDYLCLPAYPLCSLTTKAVIPFPKQTT